MTLVTLLQPMLDALLPRRCVGCGAYDTWLCSSCVRMHLRARRTPLPRDLRLRTGITSITTLGFYSNPLWQEAVRSLKFHGVREVAEVCGALLADVYGRSDDPAIARALSTIVIPVPLHRRRERERGFNQSALLGRVVAERIGALYANEVLQRVRRTSSQTIHTHEERYANVASVFDLGRAASLVPQHARLVLVDDVVTTGATTIAATEVLRQLNPACIDIIAIARGSS